MFVLKRNLLLSFGTSQLLILWWFEFQYLSDISTECDRCKDYPFSEGIAQVFLHSMQEALDLIPSTEVHTFMTSTWK